MDAIEKRCRQWRHEVSHNQSSQENDHAGVAHDPFSAGKLGGLLLPVASTLGVFVTRIDTGTLALGRHWLDSSCSRFLL